MLAYCGESSLLTNMPNQELSFEQWLRPLTGAVEKLPSLARMLSDTYRHLALHSSEQFLPTPVTNFPTRSDRGEYLAIDFGGTNLRIAFISLLGTEIDERSPQIAIFDDRSVTHESRDSYDNDFSKSFGRSWPIEEQLKVEKADDLFDWLGGCLVEVVGARFGANTTASVPAEIPLGITFSFPMMYVCISILLSEFFYFSACQIAIKSLHIAFLSSDTYCCWSTSGCLIMSTAVNPL